MWNIIFKGKFLTKDADSFQEKLEAFLKDNDSEFVGVVHNFYIEDLNAED